MEDQEPFSLDITKPLTRGMEVRAEGIDHDEYIIPMCISTNRIDSYRSIILQDGIDHQERYAENPIYVWNHPLNDYFGSPGPDRVLAKALGKPMIEGEGPEARTIYRYKFAVRNDKGEIINPTALMVFNLIAGGYLNASSVGIYPKARGVVWGDSEEEELEALPAFARDALTRGAARFVVARSVLAETSCTFVGSNTGALACRSDATAPAAQFAQAMNDLLARAEAAVLKLERAAMTPEEREFRAFVEQVESDPELKAILSL
jgi:hypothetical protein